MPAKGTPGDSAALADGEADGESEDRTRRILAFILLVAIILFVVWWFLTQLILVPDLVGLPQDSACDSVEGCGFRVGDITTATAGSDVMAGTVLDQSPDAGSRALRGSEVDIVVAAGAGAGPGDERPPANGGGLPPTAPQTEPITDVPYDTDPIMGGPQVPIVLNMTLADARAALSSAGYSPEVHYGPSTAGVVKGRVYYQNPAPESFEGRGAVVVIWVSIGPPQGGGPYPQPD